MYFGGKNGNGTYQNIINKIPPHKRYIELFLGSGAILNNKLPALENYGVEINRTVIDKFNYYPFAFISNECVFSWIKKNNHLFDIDTFVYMDPPYPISSRKSSRNVYEYQLSDQQHEEILKILVSMRARCKIAISTYKNDLYTDYLHDWNLFTFDSQTHKGKAREYLYMNYPDPVELHDYNFLGEDFTDRQRIKRKIQREINKLKRLPTLEKEAILSGIRAGIIDKNDCEPWLASIDISDCDQGTL